MGIFNFHNLFLVVLLLLPSAAPDIASDRAALLSLRSAVGGRVLFWNLSSATPCSWTGVICAGDNSSVVELRLPAMGLSGNIPPNTVSNLTSLQTLSLRYNSLSGPLPPDLFSSLTSLRNLYMQHNFFTGEVPNSLFSVASLVRVNLAENNFSGPIPPSFNNLNRLGTLYLQDNHFSGSIPDLNLPSLVQFDVSNNNLTGRIPQGLAGKSRASFAWNSLCGTPLASCGDEKPPKKKLSAAAIAGIIIGFFFISLLIFSVYRLLAGKGGALSKEKEVETPAAAVGGKGEEKGEESVGLVFFGKTGWNFDLEDLLRASAEVLGKGSFGTTYKAVVEKGGLAVAVAVKRLRDADMGEREFRGKMEEIGRLDHDNLVPLRAYYYNRDEKLLVYDYLPIGSLSALLHGSKGGIRSPLKWETRLQIALGAAEGISYLHSQDSSISQGHGNIKSSNILLTKSYQTRLSDVGLATHLHQVSPKADVYSFGVLLLELLTGKAHGEGVDLPRWVQSVLREEGTPPVFDDELLRYQNVEEDMLRLLQLAVRCADHYPDKRPSMPEATAAIQQLCRRDLREMAATDIAEE